MKIEIVLYHISTDELFVIKISKKELKKVRYGDKAALNLYKTFELFVIYLGVL